jgi:hypothetical protein
MNGCLQISRGMIKPNSVAKNEVVVANELRMLLDEKPRPKIVIRVSNPPIADLILDMLSLQFEKIDLSGSPLKHDKQLTFTYLRKALAGGLAQLIVLKEIRLKADLGNTSGSDQFISMLAEYATAPENEKERNRSWLV